jgi:hypothetical protein
MFSSQTFFPDGESVTRHWDPRQTEIQFFFPLTEQIPLDLDYTDCERPKLTVTTYGTGTTFVWPEPTCTTNIAPQLTVSPINSIGTLAIGGINVGLETTPKWYQRLLYKLLGFNWKKQ